MFADARRIIVMSRYGGDIFDIDLNEEISEPDLRSKMRFRMDKMIPSFDQAFNEMAPENSEPMYSRSGSYQPEVAYGA